MPSDDETPPRWPTPPIEEGATGATEPMNKKKQKRSNPVMLTDEQQVDMGEWLRLNPYLYTKSMKDYKNSQKKLRLWEEKTAEMGLDSVASLKTWYESIRTKVGKVSTKKSGSASKDRTDRDEFIMSNFGFLSTHISRVRGRTACSISSTFCFSFINLT